MPASNNTRFVGNAISLIGCAGFWIVAPWDKPGWILRLCVLPSFLFSAWWFMFRRTRAAESVK